jgi:hypothetical protein
VTPSKTDVLELAIWLNEAYARTPQGQADGARSWKDIPLLKRERYMQVAALLLADPPAVLVKAINSREGAKP